MTETVAASALADAISALITDSDLAQGLTEGLGDALVVGQVVQHVTAAIDAAESSDKAAWQQELDQDVKTAEKALTVAREKIPGLKAAADAAVKAERSTIDHAAKAAPLRGTAARRQRRAWPLGRPARRVLTHNRLHNLNSSSSSTRVQHSAAFLGSDCPARGLRVKSAYGVTARATRWEDWASWSRD